MALASTETRDPSAQHFDVLIIGAGISGISAAYHLQKRCPGKTYAILEARGAIGGTWDFFKYPGLRSDSDLYTLGFSFRPWTGDKAIADGPSILTYVRETARAYGIDRQIRFDHRAISAAWDWDTACWRLEVQSVGRAFSLTCSFLYVGAGYYDYENGYLPQWPGKDRFTGPIVHPQAWPDDFEYADKKVVVIGSGATAVTLVPEMAKSATKVTMLQRSPTYIVALPSRDVIADWLRARLPSRLAHGLTRWKNILLSMAFFQFARRKPEAMTRRILTGVRAHLGPDYDVATHFTPRYKPWDQRLCLVPDGDLFQAIRSGKVAIETDEIETFTETGLQLRSGRHLDADAIVTATGLQLRMMGGMTLTVDGHGVDSSKTMLYKGMLLSDVPNLAVAVGYTNASWTLKCELTARYVCRLLNHMEARGDKWCVPRRADLESAAPALTFTSGYIERAKDILPKQGGRKPWRLYQNYLLDLAALRYGRLDDGTLEFGRPARQQAA